MSSQEHPPGDLTARARIRDAALEQFARRGVAGATMRQIAQAAGVSLGLVQHHFGSKDGLRRACDELVVEVFQRRLVELSRSGRLGDAGALGDLFDRSPLLMRYLARATMDGSAAADTVFDHLADGTETFLRENWPDRFPPGSEAAADTATVMTAMHGGIILLIGQIARRFGQEPEEAIGSGRVAAGVVALYTAMGEFITSTTGESIGAAVDDRRAQQEGGAS